MGDTLSINDEPEEDKEIVTIPPQPLPNWLEVIKEEKTSIGELL